MYIILATSSSVYRHAPYYGDYNAYLAVDGFLSPGNSGFFHSHLETYPWLKIAIKLIDNSDYKAKAINRVQIYQRCDANELYHQTNFLVMVTDDPAAKAIIPTPRLSGGSATCGTTQTFQMTGGTNFIVPCAGAPLAGIKEVAIQKTTMHSHGSGWPGYNGNQWNSYTGSAPAQNSNWPVCFLMINEVVLY